MNRERLILAAAIVAAAFFLVAWAARPGDAYDLPHSRAQRDLTPALQRSLSDKVSADAEPYLDKEDEKHSEGKIYTDLQQKFEYLPNYGPRGQLVVSVKLGGAEYDPAKHTTAKGAPTGNLRYLVFTYAFEHGKWVRFAKPKWEVQALGAKGRAEMSRNMQRGERRKAEEEKAAKTHAAAAAAAAAAQKAANTGD
jgi:hypothetical protein